MTQSLPDLPRAADPDSFHLREPPVPLTDREPDGRVAAAWAVIIIATVLLFVGVAAAVRGWW